MKLYSDFDTAIHQVGDVLRDQSHEIKPFRWQSSDVSDRPEAAMRERLNVSFQVSLGGREDLGVFRSEIRPNLPWADDHFEERVSGVPLNPGEQWRNWPWALSADGHRKEEGKFSHTYMERYWPKRAGRGDDIDERGITSTGAYIASHYGVRYAYGDLNDVVDHLGRDPLTRQAFLPVWFPEDTGVVHGQRVPCTLGYHFILRNEYLHHTYYIRSCDFYRHFRDDLYLSVRLHLWILDRLRQLPLGAEPGRSFSQRFWDRVKPGLFTFHCVSMHLFINDAIKLWPEKYGKSPNT